MNVRRLARERGHRRSLVGLTVLVLLSPVFAWASERTGYAEPMDNAVELAGMAPDAVPTGISLLSEYAVPGLGPHLGTLGAALLGTSLTLFVGIAFARLLAAGE